MVQLLCSKLLCQQTAAYRVFRFRCSWSKRACPRMLRDIAIYVVLLQLIGLEGTNVQLETRTNSSGPWETQLNLSNIIGVNGTLQRANTPNENATYVRIVSEYVSLNFTLNTSPYAFSVAICFLLRLFPLRLFLSDFSFGSFTQWCFSSTRTFCSGTSVFWAGHHFVFGN